MYPQNWPEPDKLLTMDEAAALLEVNPMTIRRWIWSGKLEGIRIGQKLIRVTAGNLASVYAPAEKKEVPQQKRPGLPGLNIERTYGVTEAANLLGIQRRAVLQAIGRHTLKAEKQANGAWKIAGQDLAEYAERPRRPKQQAKIQCPETAVIGH